MSTDLWYRSITASVVPVVVISAAGLLYQLNLVMHEFSEDMSVEASYLMTIGVLVLFWNILSFIMRLTRR